MLSTQDSLRKGKARDREDRVKGTNVAEHVSKLLKSDLFAISSDIARLEREDPAITTLFSKCVPESTQVTGRRK